MLDQGLYTSRYDNNIFAGRSAYQAAEIEENKKKSSGPPPDHVTYHRVTHGMPMIGLEVDCLISVAFDNRVTASQQAEAFMLLCEFHVVASHVIPKYCDTAMQHILDKKFDPCKQPNVKGRYLQMYKVPRYMVEPGSSGMKMPDFADVLHVDSDGHGCPAGGFGLARTHTHRIPVP